MPDPEKIRLTRRAFLQFAGGMLASTTPLGVALPAPSTTRVLHASGALPSEVSSLIYRWLSCYYGGVIDRARDQATLLTKLKAMQSLPEGEALEELAYEIANATPYEAQTVTWLKDAGRIVASTPIDTMQIRQFLTEYKERNGDFLYGFLTGNRSEEDIVKLFAQDNALGPMKIGDTVDRHLETLGTLFQRIQKEADKFPALREAVAAIQKMRKEKAPPTAIIPNFGMGYRSNMCPIPTDYYRDATTNSWHERLLEQAQAASDFKTKTR